MLLSSQEVPLAAIGVLFGGLLVAGTAATLPLFGFSLPRLVRSKLGMKIGFWIPIFLVFVAALYLTNAGRLVLLAALLGLALREALRVAAATGERQLVAGWYGIFAVMLLHFFWLGAAWPEQTVPLLVVIGFGSVLSDVVAFFAGTFWGRHKLPATLNPRKSWEGVAGQVLGALLGVGLVHALVVPVPSLWLFVPIGAGAAAGDLANSFVKRRLGIKDWSQAIPGHGGYLDRLSSLAGSAALTFYALLTGSY